MVKKVLKKILANVLGQQVKRLRKKNNFKIIGVVGSIGKTSTKLTIAKILATEKRVQYEEGNYNDIVSVPLVIFGQRMPTLWNVLTWVWILFKNELKIFKKYLYDFVVLELGTDAPGQIIEFKKYLHLDVGVVTAIAPEHMEFFKNLEGVSEEEWSVRFFADKIFANRDLCEILPKDLNYNQIDFYGQNIDPKFKMETFSLAQIYSASAGIAVANFFKISEEKIKSGLTNSNGFAGRMQKLEGINNSIIIDDTYNASPEAVKMALDALYKFPASQRIAILGMMNELGSTSEIEHLKVGKYCDPEKLDLVVTVGKDANLFLAREARNKGCKVYDFKNSVEAGIFLKDKIKNGAVILAKGSQNGVFVEETLKPLLAKKTDISRLVRQDKNWLKKKGILS